MAASRTDFGMNGYPPHLHKMAAAFVRHVDSPSFHLYAGHGCAGLAAFATARRRQPAANGSGV
ncbi:hypothetical protein KCP73_08910 [Salmonella enterica subsp. enterica]|nr:hypothetical protein KCP73_08910 [Salmonella enterica subsp. enterica]